MGKYIMALRTSPIGRTFSFSPFLPLFFSAKSPKASFISVSSSLVILFSLASLDCLCFGADAAGEAARRLAGYETLLVIARKEKQAVLVTIVTAYQEGRWRLSFDESWMPRDEAEVINAHPNPRPAYEYESRLAAAAKIFSSINFLSFQQPASCPELDQQPLR